MSDVQLPCAAGQVFRGAGQAEHRHAVGATRYGQHDVHVAPLVGRPGLGKC